MQEKEILQVFPFCVKVYTSLDKYINYVLLHNLLNT